MSINQNYLVPDDSAVALPFLMASNYQPQTLQDELNLVITDEVAEQLSETVRLKLLAKSQPQSIAAGGERKDAHSLTHAKWVILAKPSGQYIFDKTADRIRKRIRNEAWVNMTTVSRVFLACAIDGEVVSDENGNIQIFTLKLSGTRCSWIYKGDRSIVGLNKALCKQWNIPPKNWLTHLVSTGIQPVPYLVEYEGQRNIRTRFQFAENTGAKPLTEIQQAACFKLVQSEEFKALMEDPFNVEQATSAAPSPHANAPTESDPIDPEYYEDIPF